MWANNKIHNTDSAYTERFMSLPSDNWNNYVHSSLTYRAQNFKGKSFMLLHGTADGN